MSATVHAPPPTHFFSTGPHCTGVPSYQCSQLGGSSLCTQTAGCVAGAGSCTGTPYPCSYWDDSSSECSTIETGCTYDSGTGICSGTPPACSTNKSTSTCQADYGCTWSTSTSCTGTPTPCTELAANKCTQTTGCTLSTQ
jgi:hypothetical protein